MADTQVNNQPMGYDADRLRKGEHPTCSSRQLCMSTPFQGNGRHRLQRSDAMLAVHAAEHAHQLVNDAMHPCATNCLDTISMRDTTARRLTRSAPVNVECALVVSGELLEEEKRNRLQQSTPERDLGLKATVDHRNRMLRRSVVLNGQRAKEDCDALLAKEKTIMLQHASRGQGSGPGERMQAEAPQTGKQEIQMEALGPEHNVHLSEKDDLGEWPGQEGHALLADEVQIEELKKPEQDAALLVEEIQVGKTGQKDQKVLPGDEIQTAQMKAMEQGVLLDEATQAVQMKAMERGVLLDEATQAVQMKAMEQGVLLDEATQAVQMKAMERGVLLDEATQAVQMKVMEQGVLLDEATQAVRMKAMERGVLLDEATQAVQMMAMEQGVLLDEATQAVQMKAMEQGVLLDEATQAVQMKAMEQGVLLDEATQARQQKELGQDGPLVQVIQAVEGKVWAGEGSLIEQLKAEGLKAGVHRDLGFLLRLLKTAMHGDVHHWRDACIGEEVCKTAEELKEVLSNLVRNLRGENQTPAVLSHAIVVGTPVLRHEEVPITPPDDSHTAAARHPPTLVSQSSDPTRISIACDRVTHGDGQTMMNPEVDTNGSTSLLQPASLSPAPSLSSSTFLTPASSFKSDPSLSPAPSLTQELSLNAPAAQSNPPPTPRLGNSQPASKAPPSSQNPYPPTPRLGNSQPASKAPPSSHNPYPPTHSPTQYTSPPTGISTASTASSVSDLSPDALSMPVTRTPPAAATRGLWPNAGVRADSLPAISVTETIHNPAATRSVTVPSHVMAEAVGARHAEVPLTMEDVKNAQETMGPSRFLHSNLSTSRRERRKPPPKLLPGARQNSIKRSQKMLYNIMCGQQLLDDAEELSKLQNKAGMAASTDGGGCSSNGHGDGDVDEDRDSVVRTASVDTGSINLRHLDGKSDMSVIEPAAVGIESTWAERYLATRVDADAAGERGNLVCMSSGPSESESPLIAPMMELVKGTNVCELKGSQCVSPTVHQAQSLTLQGEQSGAIEREPQQRQSTSLQLGQDHINPTAGVNTALEIQAEADQVNHGNTVLEQQDQSHQSPPPLFSLIRGPVQEMQDLEEVMSESCTSSGIGSAGEGTSSQPAVILVSALPPPGLPASVTACTALPNNGREVSPAATAPPQLPTAAAVGTAATTLPNPRKPIASPFLMHLPDLPPDVVACLKNMHNTIKAKQEMDESGAHRTVDPGAPPQTGPAEGVARGPMDREVQPAAQSDNESRPAPEPTIGIVELDNNGTASTACNQSSANKKLTRGKTRRRPPGAAHLPARNVPGAVKVQRWAVKGHPMGHRVEFRPLHIRLSSSSGRLVVYDDFLMAVEGNKWTKCNVSIPGCGGTVTQDMDMPHSNITHMALGAQGYTWLGFSSGKVHVLGTDIRDKPFELEYPAFEGCGVSVLAAGQGQSGEVWIGGENGELRVVCVPYSRLEVVEVACERPGTALDDSSSSNCGKGSAHVNCCCANLPSAWCATAVNLDRAVSVIHPMGMYTVVAKGKSQFACLELWSSSHSCKVLKHTCELRLYGTCTCATTVKWDTHSQGRLVTGHAYGAVLLWNDHVHDQLSPLIKIGKSVGYGGIRGLACLPQLGALCVGCLRGIRVTQLPTPHELQCLCYKANSQRLVALWGGPVTTHVFAHKSGVHQLTFIKDSVVTVSAGSKRVRMWPSDSIKEVMKREGMTTETRVSEARLQKLHNNQQVIKEEDLLMRETLGEGAHGIVKKAVWDKNVVVAVKTAVSSCSLGWESACKEDGGQGTSPGERELLREVQMLAELHHPNVAGLLGVVLCPKTRQCKKLVMEYYPQRDVYCFLRRAVQLSWSNRLRMLLDVASGMLYLHSRVPMVVHGDLRSPNLLIDDSNRVKIADFGSARKLLYRNCAPTSKLANPRWCAPEKLGGGLDSAAADVYSFGIILWEFLALVPPFDDKDRFPNDFAVMHYVKAGGRPDIPNQPLATAAPPDAYIPLMEKCWDGDPCKRPTFQDIDREIAKMLRAEQEGAGVNAGRYPHTDPGPSVLPMLDQQPGPP